MLIIVVVGQRAVKVKLLESRVCSDTHTHTQARAHPHTQRRTRRDITVRWNKQQMGHIGWLAGFLSRLLAESAASYSEILNFSHGVQTSQTETRGPRNRFSGLINANSPKKTMTKDDKNQCRHAEYFEKKIAKRVWKESHVPFCRDTRNNLAIRTNLIREWIL